MQTTYFKHSIPAKTVSLAIESMPYAFSVNSKKQAGLHSTIIRVRH